MRTSVAALGAAALLAVGLTAAVALGSSSSTRSDSTTRAAPTNTHSTPSATGTDASAPKVWVCHHTGSWKHPYHLINISSNALPAHRGHGDVDPGAGKSCPSAQPAGTGHGHEQAAEQRRAEANEHARGSKADDDAEPDGEDGAPPARSQTRP